MRINGYSPVVTDLVKQGAVSKAENAVKSGSKSDTQPASSEDKTTLTSASAVQSLAQSALANAPLRAAKVENLKQAVNSAQYQLDAAKIAEALSNGEV